MWKKPLLKFYLLIITVVFLPSVSFNLVHASEFTADIIQNMGGMTIKGKIFVKGKNYRQEINMAGTKQIVVFLGDKGTALMLMPDNMMYMEMPAGKDTKKDPMMDQKRLEKIAEKKSLGKEKVNGYHCQKLRYTFHDKSLGTTTQWFSKKLNFPIKIEADGPSGRMSTEYKNIKEKKVPDSLFTIPSGYKKMSMPDMGM